MYKYVIRKSRDDQYYWSFETSTGVAIMWSETFTTKQNCKNGIESSKANLHLGAFEKKISSDGKYFFNQKAANGETLATSRLHYFEKDRDNDINIVMYNAKYAVVEDMAYSY